MEGRLRGVSVGYIGGVGGLGATGLRENVNHLLPSLRQSTDLSMLLPHASALFTLASVRAKVAENLVALRALAMFGASTTGDLRNDQALVIQIVGSWALPAPPPALAEEGIDQVFPVRYDLSAEAATLRGGPTEGGLSDIDHLLRADLEQSTNQALDALIQAVFKAGSTESMEREEALPGIARNRADFVAKTLAMGLRDSLSIPGGTLSHLPEGDRQFLSIVRHWGGTFSTLPPGPGGGNKNIVCTKCGRPASEGDRFCAACGSALRTSD